jgi:aminoglycoside phosphotransferase (APT) family kinase protein
VRLHAIDVAKTGLIGLGKPEGFLERQVQGWAERWNRAKTDDAPELERVIGWLIDRRPVSPPPTLVHNDYKLDNVMLAAEWGIASRPCLTGRWRPLAIRWPIWG